MFVLAFGANAWMLGLEFQNDDYREIPHAGIKLGLEPPPADVAWADALRNTTYSYRPTLWLSLFGLSRLSGAHPDPRLFHLFFLCGHALASLIVCRLATARAGPAAGAAGGALFGLLPGGIQAASWVSAGGDQLAVLLMLVAAATGDRVLRGRSAACLAACSTAVAAAVLAKETALVLVPALLLVWAIPPSGALPGLARRARLALSVAAGAVVAWTARGLVLEVWLPQYWGGARAIISLAPLPTVLRGFLAPWHAPGATPNLDPATARLLAGLGLPSESLPGAVTLIVCAAIALPLVVAFALASTRARLATLAFATVGFLALLPVLPVTTNGIDASRALYPASLLLSALVACSWRALELRNRWLPLALAPFFLLSIDFLVHVARTETHVASLIRVARQDVVGVLGRQDGAHAIIIPPPDWVRSVPFLGDRVTAAVLPPFGAAREAPLTWPTAGTLRLCPAIREDPARIEALGWDGARYSALFPALPSLPEEAPDLGEDTAARGVYRPRAVIPPRGIAGILIQLAAAETGPAACSASLVAASRSRELRMEASGPGPHVMSLCDDAFDEPWFREPALDSVRIDSSKLARPPVLLRSLPAVVVRIGDRGRLSLRSAPRASFSSDAPAAFFRLTVEAWIDDARVPLAWTVDASSVPAGQDGLREMVAMGTGAVLADGKVVARVAWAEVAARLAPVAQSRMWHVAGVLRIEALDASGSNVIARSAWQPVVIVP